MKRFFTWGIALFFSFSVSAQSISVPDINFFPELKQSGIVISPELFYQLMATQPELPAADIQAQYHSLQETALHLKQKMEKSKSMEQFLKYLFYYIHRTHLKDYQSYATLSDLLSANKYDCVSGTALYALLLDALKINFTVQEMTYHLYLEIPLNGGVALIESTDPLSGLVLSEKAVAQRKATYQSETVDQTVYSQPIRAQIGMEELIGLSFFNAAVRAYNQQQFTEARQQLREAIRWYPADRMYAFQTIVESVATR